MKQKEHKIDLLSLISRVFKIFFDNGLKGDKIMINSFLVFSCLLNHSGGRFVAESFSGQRRAEIVLISCCVQYRLLLFSIYQVRSLLRSLMKPKKLQRMSCATANIYSVIRQGSREPF